MPPFRRRPYTPKTNGAKEGLEKKMAYWADKDYNYEFGVTLGAARGNLFSYLGRVPSEDETFEEFTTMLRLKSSERFRNAFHAYYSDKKNEDIRAMEKAEQRLDDAQLGSEDFEGGEPQILI